jgi:hypothetical protein
MRFPLTAPAGLMALRMVGALGIWPLFPRAVPPNARRPPRGCFLACATPQVAPSAAPCYNPPDRLDAFLDFWETNGYG